LSLEDGRGVELIVAESQKFS